MQIIINSKHNPIIVDADYIRCIKEDNRIEILVGDNYFKSYDSISSSDYLKIIDKIKQNALHIIDLTNTGLIFGMNIV